MRYRSHVYRLYPTPEQADRLANWVGVVRFVYNLALEQRKTFSRPDRRFNYVGQGRELKDLRAAEDWVADCPANPLHQALQDLDAACRHWAAGRAREPRYRRAGHNDAMRFHQPRDVPVRRTGRKSALLRIPKLGELRLRLDCPYPADARSVTIRRRGDQWFAVVLHATERPPLADAAASPVGIDRGVTVFAALSTGELIVGPRPDQTAAPALARAQRQLARKRRGSANYRKQRRRVTRLHARVRAARSDFLHKTSTRIAKSHGVIVVEDLKVRNMTATAKGTAASPGRNVRQKAGLNRAILAQGWGEFARLLAYKAEDRGGHLLAVPAYDTSRTCAACGVVDADSRKGVEFACRACGHTAHADTNAAVNILRRGTPSMPAEAPIGAVEPGTSASKPHTGGCRRGGVGRPAPLAQIAPEVPPHPLHDLANVVSREPVVVHQLERSLAEGAGEQGGDLPLFVRRQHQRRRRNKAAEAAASR